MSACPRPDKACFTTYAEAVGVLRKLDRRRRKGMHVYQCKCGWYHHGRKTKRAVVAWRATP